MKIIVVGATGKIGSAVVAALAHHEVVPASRANGVDITRPDTLRTFFAAHAPVDAVISVAGGAVWRPLAELSDADFETSLSYKLMGQVNLARIAIPFVRDGGSITLTAGTFAREPAAGSAAIALVNAGIEGFAIGASRDMPRGIRINAVSPPIVGERRISGGRIDSMPAEEVALAYIHAVEGHSSGEVIDARHFARRS